MAYQPQAETLDCYLYISHLDEGLQYWQLPQYPDTITDTMSSTFTATQALGRTAPVYTYANSGPRNVQVTLSFPRDLLNDINYGGRSNAMLENGEDYADALIRALRSIAVPRYNLENKAIEPPLLALRLGNEVFIKGVLSGSIGVTYNKPLLANDKYSNVSIGLSIDEVDPYDATEVYKEGGFRGMTNTMRAGMNYSEVD